MAIVQLSKSMIYNCALHFYKLQFFSTLKYEYSVYTTCLTNAHGYTNLTIISYYYLLLKYKQFCLFEKNKLLFQVFELLKKTQENTKLIGTINHSTILYEVCMFKNIF